MSKRKWLDSRVRIRSVNGLLESIEAYGGAMWNGKFRNKHFFLNQQMRTIQLFVNYCMISYPIINKKEESNG